jgi:hypothetical protein
MFEMPRKGRCAIVVAAHMWEWLFTSLLHLFVLEPAARCISRERFR